MSSYPTLMDKDYKKIVSCNDYTLDEHWGFIGFLTICAKVLICCTVCVCMCVMLAVYLASVMWHVTCSIFVVMDYIIYY